MGRAIFIGEQLSGPLDAGHAGAANSRGERGAAGGGAEEGEGARRHAARPLGCRPSSVLRVNRAHRRRHRHCPCHRDRGLRGWVGGGRVVGWRGGEWVRGESKHLPV